MKTRIHNNKKKSYQHVLITGGAGFIGTKTALFLINSGHEVTILDNLSPQIHGKRASLNPELKGKVNFIHADIRDSAALKLGLTNADAIIHLAAETGMGQSQYEISRYVSVNIQAQAELLQIMINGHHYVKKLIVASSSRIYGEGMYHCKSHGVVYPQCRSKEQLKRGIWELSCPICNKRISPLPNKENALPSPTSIYAVSKLTQEHLALVFGNTYKIPTIALRYQNVYGAGQSLNNPYTGIISNFSTRILNGKPPIIYEDGKPTRDFVYIDDVARATVLALESNISDCCVINIGAGKAISIMNVAKQLLKAMKSKLKPQISGEFRVGDVRHSCADISLAKNVLGYVPNYSPEKGLKEYAVWLHKHRSVIDQSKMASNQLKKLNLLGKKSTKINKTKHQL